VLFGHWRSDLTKIVVANERWGIVWVVGIFLHVLKLVTLTGILCIEDRRVIDWYVVVALILSVGIYYLPPSVCLAAVSTYFSVGTVIVLLNIVLLQRVFGRPYLPERSLLLFMCNVAQIVFMFATWYRLCKEPEPLLTSILTFATIGYAHEMTGVAMTQIATNFVLLAIFLSHLVGQLGPKNGGS
jgi:hypothetical protein